MSIATIKNLIPLKIKQSVTGYINAKDIVLPNGSRCFVFLAADYGNIGDIAISTAQKQYLENILTDYKVISIPISQTRFVLSSIKKQIKTNDIVTIIGGGNMGSIYPDIEELRQLVIKSFPANRIVCFPQTLDWDSSAKSKRILKTITKNYAKHPDIHVFARESITQTKLNEIFNIYDNVNVGLVPDIVMSATAASLGTIDSSQGLEILRCLRDDKEVALSTVQYSIVDKALADTGYKIEKTDTHAGGSQLDETYCAKLLSDKLRQFRAAKLVVTDRLHGMILCLLSGTPCLVLPNSNHKIRQTQSDWLYDHPRLIFLELDEIDNINESISKLLSLPKGDLHDSPVGIKKYNGLKKALTHI
ncbi:polysaccharide pyruvyl transferase family protein [uncultured Psychrobacter sp.]|uniref:polysaccharide pyruvyl transferase family protein n=1 Tax=uncultured Psychrobacter sp. TaxID=259303 RepID=UPI00261C68AC|nr:polysaccharide pyruvyl transferase family protein [uncultured Psychrobacter sp.]